MPRPAPRSGPSIRCDPVERGADARVPPAVARLRRLCRREHRRTERVEEVRQRRDLRDAGHLEEARRDHPRELGAVREHDLPVAPRGEVVSGEVRADRPEVLGRRHRAERHAPGGRVASGRVAGTGLSLQRAQHHPRGGDGRQRVDGHAVGRLLADLPGERGDRPLGAAVGARVGGAPSRSRGDAEDAAAAGGGHDRQRRPQHREVSVDVHREHGTPVLLDAAGESGGATDAGDVDDGVERPELVDEPGEERADRVVVGDRDVRRPGLPARFDDALRGGRIGASALGRAVDGDARVDGHDEHTLATELLGDGGPDAHGATGHHRDAHDPSPASMSSQPSKSPRARQSARRSRYPKKSPYPPP